MRMIPIFFLFMASLSLGAPEKKFLEKSPEKIALDILYRQKYGDSFKAYDVDHDGLISKQDIDKCFLRKITCVGLAQEWIKKIDKKCNELLDMIKNYPSLGLEEFALYKSFKNSRNHLNQSDVEFLKGKKMQSFSYLAKKWKVDGKKLQKAFGKRSKNDLISVEELVNFINS